MHLQFDLITNPERGKAVDAEIRAIEASGTRKAHGVATGQKISSAAVKVYFKIHRRGDTMNNVTKSVTLGYYIKNSKGLLSPYLR